ncbi:Rib/alpha-like domain-containing protein [Streptococcus sp. sy004]|uniref:Rib/alpha-like domain-containing protein n=1 Tax=Streptococcus sp. sy004 TaxID=2600149 RepID=UPI0011B5A5A8|nr:Rib/alpha-like domain-containing protein [Streptococcus sp. sy004]TWT12401.1 LPXTG cell wall anchor domain-containing protein [Streptococcus sp. sy004]
MPPTATDGTTDTTVVYTPNQATSTDPNVGGVEVVEGTPITEKDITDKVTGLPDGTKVTVKDPSSIPGTDTPGDKGTVTVIVEYPDGSTEEVEVPVVVTPNDATKTTPNVGGVEVTEGTPITEKDITDKVTGIPEGTKVTVKDPSSIPSTDTPGDKGTVTVIVEYPDGSTEEVEVPVVVTPNQATSTDPNVDKVEVVEGTPITEKDITDKVTGLPDGTKVTVKDPSSIPSTDTPGDKGTVTVIVEYPDGSTEEVEVPVVVTPKTPTDADKNTPTVDTVDVTEGTPITEKDITDKVTGLPDGTKVTVKDPSSIPSTDIPGDKGTVTVIVEYPDGSTEEVEVPVVVTPKTPTDADKNTPTVDTVEVTEGTPITEKDITDKVTGLPDGSKVTLLDPIPDSSTAGNKGTVRVEITYPDGSKEIVEVPVNVTPKATASNGMTNSNTSRTQAVSSARGLDASARAYANSDKDSGQKATMLPNTGTESNASATAAGIGMILATLGLAGKRRRKED